MLYFLSSTIALCAAGPPARHPSTRARARRPPAFALMHALASPSFNCTSCTTSQISPPTLSRPQKTYKATVNRKFMVDLDANGHYGDPKDGCASRSLRSLSLAAVRGHHVPDRRAGRRDGDAGVRAQGPDGQAVLHPRVHAVGEQGRRHERPAPRPARPSRASASARTTTADARRHGASGGNPAMQDAQRGRAIYYAHMHRGYGRTLGALTRAVLLTIY